jgi:Concanavalin A-like lectin/glucanases superfamily
MNRARQVLSVLTVVAMGFFAMGMPPAAAASTVAWWHMDEASGRMRDASGSGNDGTLQNVARVSPGFNGHGRAYRFNGTNSRVIVPDAPSLDPGARNITVTVHVKTSGSPPPSVGDYDLIRKGSGIYKMEIFGTGQGFCQFQGTGGRMILKAGPNLADGRWHTITCRKTSSHIQLTVDGATWSKTGAAGPIASGAPLVLGGKPNGSGDWFRGVMDQVSIAFG